MKRAWPWESLAATLVLRDRVERSGRRSIKLCNPSISIDALPESGPCPTLPDTRSRDGAGVGERAWRVNTLENDLENIFFLFACCRSSF